MRMYEVIAYDVKTRERYSLLFPTQKKAKHFLDYTGDNGKIENVEADISPAHVFDAMTWADVNYWNRKRG